MPSRYKRPRLAVAPIPAMVADHLNSASADPPNGPIMSMCDQCARFRLSALIALFGDAPTVPVMHERVWDVIRPGLFESEPLDAISIVQKCDHMPTPGDTRGECRGVVKSGVKDSSSLRGPLGNLNLMAGQR